MQGAEGASARPESPGSSSGMRPQPPERSVYFVSEASESPAAASSSDRPRRAVGFSAVDDEPRPAWARGASGALGAGLGVVRTQTLARGLQRTETLARSIRKVKLAEVKEVAIEATTSAANKTMIAILAVVRVQVFIMELLVAFKLNEQGRMSWAGFVIMFAFLPGALLCISFLQKGRPQAALWAAAGVSFLFACWDSWKRADFTKELVVASDVYTMFDSLPQFMLQSYLMLQNHFVGQQCEEAFDLTCTQQCLDLPPQFGGAFSRFDCQQSKQRGFQNNPEECWTWYNRCINKCAATEFLTEKQSAEDAFAGLLKNPKSWNPSNLLGSRQRRLKTQAAFESVMSEDSGTWAATGCDPQASVYEVLFPGIPQDSSTDKVRAQVKTMRFKVLLMYSQIFSLASSALSLAGSLTLRVMQTDERCPGTTREIVRQAGGFYLHYLLDICAWAGCLSFFICGATSTRTRAIVLGGIALMFQVPFHNCAALRKLVVYKRAGCAVAHALISPLARMPSAPELPAELVRRLLKLRLFCQVLLAGLGLYTMTQRDPLGFTMWAADAIICCLLGLAGLGATFLQGPKAVWSDEWDKMTRDHISRKVLRKSKLQILRFVWKTWAPKRSKWLPQALPGILGGNHQTELPKQVDILAFLREDDSDHADTDEEPFLGFMGDYDEEPCAEANTADAAGTSIQVVEAETNHQPAPHAAPPSPPSPEPTPQAPEAERGDPGVSGSPAAGPAAPVPPVRAAG